MCQAGTDRLDGSSRAAEAADARHTLRQGPATEAAHRHAGGGPPPQAQASAGTLPARGGCRSPHNQPDRMQHSWAFPLLWASFRVPRRWTLLPEPRSSAASWRATPTKPRSKSCREGCAHVGNYLRNQQQKGYLRTHLFALPHQAGGGDAATLSGRGAADGNAGPTQTVAPVEDQSCFRFVLRVAGWADGGLFLGLAVRARLNGARHKRTITPKLPFSSSRRTEPSLE